MNKFKFIWFLFVIGFVIFSITMILKGPSKTLVFENIEKQEYDGVIQKKIIDTNDHFGNKIILNGYKQSIHWKLATVIEEGDSVIKQKGKTYLKIYKLNGDIIIFDLVNNKIR
ncbi:hypothetical protein SAMN05444377_10820 [Flavobacterium fontis]|uniref:Uncharacterized protein n=1 Tax=Flavobacterium fontis TaxID=1124188 RepID=A0A1M5BC49_9FLAO|nr:hypothetical protein [Flavobacterium fontis]SHF40005.1 hypothetical protein SAMN05444377_10820 [Flavobacterium fontis]